MTLQGEWFIELCNSDPVGHQLRETYLDAAEEHFLTNDRDAEAEKLSCLMDLCEWLERCGSRGHIVANWLRIINGLTLRERSSGHRIVRVRSSR